MARKAPPDFDTVFQSLRAILRTHATGLSVTSDEPGSFCLEGAVGPAALRAWGGKMKRETMPIAWVQVGEAYVSYHLMGVSGNATLCDGMSKALKARMQGKTCFNFKKRDDELFAELGRVTAQAIAAFRKAGFIAS